MNELIPTIENEDGNLLVSGRDLHEFLESALKEELDLRIFSLLKDFWSIVKENSGNVLKTKYELLKVSVQTYDYFDLVILDSFLEKLHSDNIIDEDLTDNKRIPSGSENAYGRYFEKEILEMMSKHVFIESTQYRGTDAVIRHPDTGEPYVVEIKCAYTDTKDQVEKYLCNTGIKKFITINGHENSISIHVLYIARRTWAIYDLLKQNDILPMIERVEGG